LSREKTDSITHLVKVVALEMIEQHLDESYKGLDERLEALETLGESSKPVEVNFGDCQRAGNLWSTFERVSLDVDLKAFLINMAKKHGRSVGAIKCELNIERY
jgi:hypothetical protein